MLVILQHLGGLRLIVFEAGIVDFVERHGARVLAQLGDLLGAEAAALVEHGRGREIARRHEKAIGDVAFIDFPRRRRHGGVELQHRFRRLLLVPERHREHAAVLQRAHVVGHGLARVGIFLDDGEAAGARQPGGVGEAQVDDVVAFGRIGEIEPPVVVDHLDLRVVEHVAGEIAQPFVGAEGVEHRGVSLRHGDAPGIAAQRDRGRDAAAELHDERVRRLLDQVGIDHRQEAVVGGRAGRQVADDAARALAVAVHAEIGVVGHLRQAERCVVGEPGREMQVRAGIDLEIAEGRSALVDALAVGKLARIGDALVVRHRELRNVEQRRQRKMSGDRSRRHCRKPEHAAAVRERREPEHAAHEPQHERHDDEVFRRQKIHRHQEGEPAQPGAGEVGEVDAAENLVGLEEHRAEIERAGEERQHVEQEVAGQPPLLHGVGDQEDGVKRNLLRQ